MEREKLKIGIDIGDVVCECYKLLINHFNKEFNKTISINDIYDDNSFEKIYNTDKIKINKSIYRFIISENIINLPLVKDAKESILKLQKDFEIIFITSRNQKNKKDTLSYLNKHFPDNNCEVFFSNELWSDQPITKDYYCVENKVSFLIEDNKKYALNCAKKGVRVFLIDKPWNKDCFEHENIIRVSNWNEIIYYLENKNLIINKNKY